MTFPLTEDQVRECIKEGTLWTRIMVDMKNRKFMAYLPMCGWSVHSFRYDILLGFDYCPEAEVVFTDQDVNQATAGLAPKVKPAPRQYKPKVGDWISDDLGRFSGDYKPAMKGDEKPWKTSIVPVDAPRPWTPDVRARYPTESFATREEMVARAEATGFTFKCEFGYWPRHR